MGSIHGHVVDRAGKPVQNAVVVAVAADGSIGNTTFTNARGRFTLGTLRAGEYQLTIYNSYTTASGNQITSSAVSEGTPSVTVPSVTVYPRHEAAAGSIAD